MKLTARLPNLATLALPLCFALAACNDDSPVDPGAELDAAIADLRYATGAYHDLDNAIDDGFVFVHGCEERPGEGKVGAVYVLPERMGQAIDPKAPQGLLYEIDHDGNATLLGAELVVPFDSWTGSEPPEFLGHAFQPEEEFGVYGLHVWVWRENPRGMFAQAHPGVDCEVEDEHEEE